MATYTLYFKATNTDEVVGEIHEQLGNGSTQKLHDVNGGQPMNLTMMGLVDKGFTALNSSVDLSDPYVMIGLNEYIALNS